MAPPQEPEVEIEAAVDDGAAAICETKQRPNKETTTTMHQTHHATKLLSAVQAEAAIQAFCEFLRFETVSGTAPTTGAYVACASWLQDQLQASGCFDQIFLLPDAPAHSPVVIAIWRGADPKLPWLWLNSHYDVVPASADDWLVDPFAAVRADGNIYGRGAQDMKCVCIQYIHALQYIRSTDPNWKPARTICLTFVPDEEVGGSGMAALLDSAWYNEQVRPIGIGLALDEGLASTTDVFSVFYGERLPWWIDVTATGPTGHGSQFVDGTAVEQLLQLTQKAMAFRQSQRALLGLDQHTNCAHAVAAAASKTRTLGDVTSLNITTLQAGVKVGGAYAYNCIPSVATCSLDIRISPHMPPGEMKTMLDTWCQECSSSSSNNNDKDDKNATNKPATTMTWSYIGGHGNDLQEHAVTSIDQTLNPWYAVFAAACADMGYPIQPQIFPAATDSRFLRALGIRALGFSPMRRTQIMLHQHNEYLPEHVFLEGIEVYIGLLKTLASQGAELEERMKQPNNT